MAWVGRVYHLSPAEAQGGDQVRLAGQDIAGGWAHGLGLARVQEDSQQHERGHNQDSGPLHQVVELNSGSHQPQQWGS